ncbi:MAG: small subunit ribosomal protein S17 [Pseudohongiellaceae bacterium]|jgi:small subunit ribosomal protein S17
MMSNDDSARNVIRKIGVVKSDRMDKTIVVKVERRLMHPVYKKIVTRYTTLRAHDESNKAKAGDTVEIEFTRPISKNKRWRLTQVLETAGGAA